jgi:tetratricopeptide (TPR) repeat protein
MNDAIIQRARLLIQQEKYSEAEQLLQTLLANEPNHSEVLALLAEINLQQNQTDEALQLINSAITNEADNSFLLFIKARIHIHRQQYDIAESTIQHAISMDAYDADYFALLAHIKLVRKNYEAALIIADSALEIDAENLLALNTRSTALLKLNRKEESFSTIEGALKEDPNNTYTHANYGWGLLEGGDHKKALEHFKEALKNNPNNENAQTGMAEALKASNLFYRWFLKYSFWMNKLSSNYQWFFIIGFYFGTRALRFLAQKVPVLQPFLIPIIILLSLIAFSTWIIHPISNLFLRLNKYGKYLLDKNEIKSSNFVGISLMIALVGGLLLLILGDLRYLSILMFGIAMMVPLSTMFSITKYPYSLQLYTMFMAIFGLIAIAGTFLGGQLINTFSLIFIVGFVAFQWIANFLIIRQSDY